MTFAYSIWLIATPFIALGAAGIIALGWRKRSDLLGRFAAPRLLDRLTEKASLQRLLIKSALTILAISAVSLSLSRPQYGVEWSERKARGLDIVFVLDSSKSMLASDLRPSRLERAKLAILDLIDRLESDRIGLIAFAGQAFLQTPPTLDYAAFRESLNATDPSILSRGGSDLGRAIEEASKAFPSENNVKVVVLLTDGEDLGGQALDSARKAASEGIRIYTIGIGTPEGVYLKLENSEGIEEFLRDNNGQPVRSQLDESTLQQIAQLTGGSYSQLGTGDLGTLYDSVLASLPREERESELQEVRIERFQWLLSAALVFLVLEILIRGRSNASAKTALLLLISIYFVPSQSEAADDSRSAFNQAYAALTEGDYATANQLYTSAMQQTKDRVLQRDALYNMGHATYQQGRATYESGDPQTALEQISAAEELFQSALELDPNDKVAEDDLKRTRSVREAIEKLLEQQNEQEQEQDSSETQDQQNEENQEQENEEQEEGSDQENQQNQDSESDEESQDSEQQEQDNQQESQSENDSQEQEGDQRSEESESSDGQEQQSQSGEEDGDDPEQSEASRPEEPEADEEQNESQPVPQVGEPEEDESEQDPGASSQSARSMQVEGMSIEEAQDLLDSLRRKEEMLPFARPAPGNGQPLKDW
ncbi:MAG: VWA domain-containing protein [Verrucomicrobiota bacterium]